MVRSANFWSLPPWYNSDGSRRLLWRELTKDRRHRSSGRIAGTVGPLQAKETQVSMADSGKVITLVLGKME